MVSLHGDPPPSTHDWDIHFLLQALCERDDAESDDLREIGQRLLRQRGRHRQRVVMKPNAAQVGSRVMIVRGGVEGLVGIYPIGRGCPVTRVHVPHGDGVAELRLDKGFHFLREDS